jgi:hypothetical protein
MGALYDLLESSTLYSGQAKMYSYSKSNRAEAAAVEKYWRYGGERPKVVTKFAQFLIYTADLLRPSQPSDRFPSTFYTGPLGANNILPTTDTGRLLTALTGITGNTTLQQRTMLLDKETAMGREYDLYHWHFDGSQSYGGVFGCEDPTADTPSGSAPGGVTKEQFTLNQGKTTTIATWTPDYSVPDMNTGAADAIWAKMATYWATYPSLRIMIRAFHEFDGGGTPGGSPKFQYGSAAYTDTEFHSAWQRMVTIMRNIASNVGFWWCPNEGGTTHGRSWLSDYYPGDAYVDWVGTDIYNHRTGVSSPIVPDPPAWASWAQLFNYGIAAGPAQSFSFWSCYDIFGSGVAVSGTRSWAGTPHVKPFMIGETSTPYDPGTPARKAAWFTDIVGDTTYGISTMDNCVGISFYDFDVHSPTDFDWRVDSNASVVDVQGTSDATTLAGYVAMANNVFMKGT